MEVGFGATPCHSRVQTGLAGRLKVMCELLWRVGDTQGSEGYRRGFLVIFDIIFDDIEYFVSSLARREDGDYVIGLDMCPFGVWCYHLVSGFVSCNMIGWRWR